MPKRRNLVCLEAKLQSGNFLIQKVNISKKQNTQRNGYITPLEWSLFGSYVANISSGNLPYNAKEKWKEKFPSLLKFGFKYSSKNQCCLTIKSCQNIYLPFHMDGINHKVTLQDVIEEII